MLALGDCQGLYFSNETMKYILLILLCLFLILLTVTIVDSLRLSIKEYTVISDACKRNYRFLFVSDLHNCSFGNNKNLYELIDDLGAEGAFVTGDMMNGCEGASFGKSIDFLKFLSEKMPVFYSYGNHEQRAKNNVKKYGSLFEDYQKALENINVELLDNCKIEYDGINIFAFSLPGKYYKRGKKPVLEQEILTDALGELPKDSFNILLAHNPEYFEEYAEFGPDLVLAGHVHGGIGRVPVIDRGFISPRLKLFPKYDGGEFSLGKTRMIISRGLGSHTIHFRPFNPRELIILNIKNH